MPKYTYMTNALLDTLFRALDPASSPMRAAAAQRGVAAALELLEDPARSHGVPSPAQLAGSEAVAAPLRASLQKLVARAGAPCRGCAVVVVRGPVRVCSPGVPSTAQLVIARRPAAPLHAMLQELAA